MKSERVGAAWRRKQQEAAKRIVTRRLPGWMEYADGKLVLNPTKADTLAQQMYESRVFSAMPILADALQEAGCDSEDILNHCRGDEPHIRGCWVVDLMLDKA